MATKKPVYVDELYGTIAPTEENDSKKWYVVRTKPQREKRLAQWAKDNEIEYYLPQYTSTRIYQYRKVEFTKPLFPGYIFVKMSKEESITLYRPGHIVTFVKVVNEKFLVAELQQIYIIRQFGLSIQPSEDNTIIEEGTKVRIKEGALKGVYGFVRDVENPKKIVVSVNIIKQSIDVEIDKINLEVIKED